MNFIEKIINKAKLDKKTIVLPESTDLRILEAAVKIKELLIANIVLIGDESEIKKLAPNLDFSGIKIENPLNSDKYEFYVNEFFELRKEKGITKEQALEIIKDPLYFGVMMVKKGDADGMVAGAIHATSDTLRPALQIIKTALDAKIVSSFFVMVVPECNYGSDGVFVYTDCGLIENPDTEQLSEIAISGAKSFQSLVGETPKVAMLSYSTYGSAKS
ncbi:MAG: phosphate acyltransferase, partial [Candidatus Gracilibacteria bacterium]|nr:phosphate acyltransferase [Candidatus Gracilibacteria bacterium]